MNKICCDIHIGRVCDDGNDNERQPSKFDDIHVTHSDRLFGMHKSERVTYMFYGETFCGKSNFHNKQKEREKKQQFIRSIADIVASRSSVCVCSL